MNNFTNQTYINAIYSAAADLNQERFELIEQFNLWRLFFVREFLCVEKPIDTLSTLPDDEQASFLKNLAQQQSLATLCSGAHSAKTTTWLNLRTGPGAKYTILGILPPETPLTIIETTKQWIHVATPKKESDVQSTFRANRSLYKTGFVHKDFVLLNSLNVNKNNVNRNNVNKNREGSLITESALDRVPLSPPDIYKIPLGEHMNDNVSLYLAKLWNRNGGLIAVLANEYQIEAELALAVLAVESQGQAFGPKNQLLIRFESHIFQQKLSPENQTRFHQHFRFDQEKPWREHQWRLDSTQSWQSVHHNQMREWAVFNFARTIDDNAAMHSISMGMPQIMGFNHRLLGYESAHQMFEAFSANERNQIIGFFDYIHNSTIDGLGVQALQFKDYTTFAECYNGRGQATFYADLIRNRFNIIRNLRTDLTPLPNPLPDPLVALDMRYIDGFSINTNRKNTNAHKNRYILAP